jgi:uracil-DNA glycosylase
MPDPERPGAQEWVPAEPTVEALQSAARACRGCELWRHATQVVFSTGPVDARLMLVGEQPGDREDLEGRPFVGPAGALLAEALEAAGVDAGSVYETNAVKHFRFEERGKRRIHAKPGVAHVTACNPWLEAEVAVVRPEVIVCLGATAGRAVLRRDVAIGRERGHELDAAAALGGGTARVLLTTHPSAVLRLRGKDGFDEAFTGLVADLRAAAALLA